MVLRNLLFWCEISFLLVINSVVSLALRVGGVALIIAGIAVTGSFGSIAALVFTGARSEGSIWTLIGGSVSAVVGVALTLQNEKPKRKGAPRE